MRNQRTATVEALVNVYNETAESEFVFNGEVNLKDVITPQQKDKTKAILFNAFKTKQVSYKPSFQYKVDNDAELNKYIGGLINNWLRKAPELNGGERYVIQNPGSRTGSSDPQIRELKKLLSKFKGTENEAKIQAAIGNRIAELKPEVEIDTDLIPAELQGLV